MFIFNPAIANSEIELEDGLGNLQLESGDALVLESSSPVAESGVQVQDENPVYAIPYYWLQPYFSFQEDPGTLFEVVWFPGTGQQMQEALMPNYDPRFIGGDIANIPSTFFVDDPSTFFEVVWMSWAGQQAQDTLMPNYDPRFIGGDIANIPYLALQLSLGIHFAPDGTGAFQGPGDFDILEGSATFEIRTPE